MVQCKKGQILDFVVQNLASINFMGNLELEADLRGSRRWAMSIPASGESSINNECPTHLRQLMQFAPSVMDAMMDAVLQGLVSTHLQQFTFRWREWKMLWLNKYKICSHFFFFLKSLFESSFHLFLAHMLVLLSLSLTLSL